MTLAMKNGESYRPFVAEFLAPVRTLVKPVSEGLFAGILDIPKVPTLKDRLMFRLSVLFGVWKEGDHRNWNAIRNWAESLSPLLLR
jgi:menaquinone-dependent protoporphyrinogen IX oxidase